MAKPYVDARMGRVRFHCWGLRRRTASVAIEPVLASWDAAHHPSQQRLRAYLDEVEAALAPAIDSDTPLALHVDVRLPPGTDLLVHRDLENYLTARAQRLRIPNLARTSASKSHVTDGDASRVDQPASSMT